MSYLDKYLSPGETAIYKCRTSRLSFFGEYALLAFLVLISVTSLFATFMSKIQNHVALAATAVILFYAFSFISLILLVRLEYKIWSVRYVLTTKRAIISEGIFSENFRSTTYDKITDVGLYQSFMDKILDIGVISIDTAGTDKIEITFENVAKPFFIKNKISEMQSAMQPIVKEPEQQPTKTKRKK